MDAVLTTLIGAAPQLGVGGILVLVMGLLIRRESQVAAGHAAELAQERADHRAQITEITGRHAAELARITSGHDAELAELSRQIVGLRGQMDELNAKLDAERARRRAAEDQQQRRDDGSRP